MSLLHPLMLGSAAAVVVPILIHLFGRPRPRLVRFPSVMMLMAVQRQRHTRTRLRRIIALILRCLALVLLALVLARPLTTWPPLASLGEKTGVSAIVVDSSPSMAVVLEDGSTPAGRAAEAADAVAAAVTAAGQVLPARAGTILRPLTGMEPVDGETARAALAAVRPSDERARIDRVLTELSGIDEQLSRVVVITDLQASSLGSTPVERTPPRTTFIDVGGEVSGNAALVEVRSREPVHLRGRPVSLEAVARSWGDTGGRQAVTATVPEGDLSTGIDLVPGQESVASVQFVPQTAGTLEVTLRLPPDDMPADDRRIFATVVRDRLRVGLLGEPQATRFIHAALNPYPEGDARSKVAVRVIREARDVAEGRLDAIVIASASAVDEATVQALAEAAARGTGLLLYSAEAPSEHLIDALGLGGVSLGAMGRPEDGARLAELVTLRPPLEGFADPGAGDLGAASFREVRDVQVADAATLSVLARFDEGTPVLVEGAAGPARTLLFATAPDASLSDLVRLPEFVPLMHRMVAYLAGGSEPSVIFSPPGETTVCALPSGDDVTRIMGPDGGEVTFTRVEDNVCFTPERVGGYRVMVGEEEVAAIAVNLDPAEADPARIGDTEAGQIAESPGADVVAWERLDEFIRSIGPVEADISSLVAFFALLLIAVEAVQSLQQGASRRGRDER